MTDQARAEQVAEEIVRNHAVFMFGKGHERSTFTGRRPLIKAITTALRAEGDRVAREGAEIAKSHRAGDSAYMWKACGGEIATALLASRGLG